MDIESRCAREIEQLHDFFVDWFNGEVEQTRGAFERFEDVMGEGFVLVGLDGSQTERDDLVESIWESWNHPADEGKRMEIETSNVRLLRSEGSVHLATYIEEQTVDGSSNRRRSSVLFREAPGTSNDLEWLFVQETPM